MHCAECTKCDEFKKVNLHLRISPHFDLLKKYRYYNVKLDSIAYPE